MTFKKKHRDLLKVQHGGKISQWILDLLRAHPRAKDALIEEAVIAHYDLKEPKPSEDE